MPRRTLQVAATIGLVLSVLVLAWAAWSWWSPPPAALPDATATPLAPTASVSPSASPSPSRRTATPTAAGRRGRTPTPSPSPTATPVPVSRVLRFEAPSAGYASDVQTMDIARTGGVINPPDFVHLWWIRDRGVLPSSTATDTTYFACHTDAKKAPSAVPCNVVNLDSVPVGAELRVTTDAEQLTYRVIQSRKVPRDSFASDKEVWDVNPGRLVWVSCYIGGGKRTDFNIVVIAELVR